MLARPALAFLTVHSVNARLARRCSSAWCYLGRVRTNFALFSEVADRVELCLFGPGNRGESRVELTEAVRVSSGTATYLPGVGPGQHYGYRGHGPYAPARGHRCNAAKLLLDPYGKAVGSGALARGSVLPPVRRARGDQHSQQRPLHAAQCSYEPVFRLGE